MDYSMTGCSGGRYPWQGLFCEQLCGKWGWHVNNAVEWSEFKDSTFRRIKMDKNGYTANRFSSSIKLKG